MLTLATLQVLTKMAYVPYSFPLTGGMERKLAPMKADKSSFYRLHNLRQSAIRGVLEPTPRFCTFLTYNRGVYNVGAGDVTEAADTSAAYFNSAGLYLSSYCAFSSTTVQIQCFKQITVPTGSTATKHCLLVMDSVATASITRGNTYDVEIDGAATFKWRVNGGGWTTLVAIDLANGNIIDTGAHLYWLASTGFTVADAWSWRRTDSSDCLNTHQPLRTCRVGNRIFYVGTSNRIYCVDVTTSGTKYIRTVGYRPVYAGRVLFFENHLLLLSSKFETTYGSSVYGYLQCSDLNNVDCFLATDTNEADQFFLAAPDSNVGNYNLDLYTGFVYQNRLYIFTRQGIWYSDYSGLPVPLNFKLLDGTNTNNIEYYDIAVVRSQIFVLGAGTSPSNTNITSLWTFDGVRLAPVFEDIQTEFGITNDFYALWYNRSNDELVIQSTSLWVVLQINYGTAYTRTVSFTGNIGGLSHLDGMFIPGSSRRIFAESDLSANALIYDSNSETVYSTPTVITQALGETLAKVKESGPVFVGMYADPTANSRFSIGANVQLNLAYYTLPLGVFPSTSTSVGTWVSSKPDGLISFPRVPYRGLAFEITFTGLTAGKPPYGFTLQAIETEVYVSDATR